MSRRQYRIALYDERGAVIEGAQYMHVSEETPTRGLPIDLPQGTWFVHDVVAFSHVRGHTEMTLQVELPANLSEDDMPEAWFGHIRQGWRDTVDRLAAALSSTSTAI